MSRPDRDASEPVSVPPSPAAPPATQGPGAETPAAPAPFGYRLVGTDVVFEFNAAALTSASIARLTIAGAFNAWDPAAAGCAMDAVGQGRFELRKPLAEFHARKRWPFKFVADGKTWYGAPPEAPNREVVIGDPASYNILLLNPQAPPDTAQRVVDLWRARIEEAWPGQGPNLAVDDNLGCHLLMNLPERDKLADMEALRGMQLVSLDLGGLSVNDLSPLRGMRSLDKFVCNGTTFGLLLSGVFQALGRQDYEAARRSAHDALDPFGDVPALNATRQLVLESIQTMQELQADPTRIPAVAREAGGHRYACILQPASWKEASDYAARAGAHLAVVTSDEEKLWLTRNFGLPSLGRTMWLGGSDEASEGAWRWPNSEPWNYTAWSGPEPNNGGGTEHALAMRYDGWWIDADGRATRMPYIIEWDTP
jgi:hypothetical protein